ncbi:hypothetical protein OHS59_16325 [Streptomyces sp. NBC_00414]|uniref:hypothetical protein n=1 Tax=Streptomyces sp. NBC_00414 TaxID=2975739 RepID=UPI002E1C5E5F
MSRPPEGSDRQARAAYCRWEGKSFPFIASVFGYPSPEAAEADYVAYMEFRRVTREATQAPDFPAV